MPSPETVAIFRLLNNLGANVLNESTFSLKIFTISVLFPSSLPLAKVD
jgi:hypothetical protein